MKKITINSENRRFNISSIAIGYLDENKVEQIEFEIPEQYKNYGKKACFSANGTTFAKLFDDITSNILTITRDISQYNELDLSIEFFKAENEDEIIARTSILHIVIENAIVCEDVKPDDEKVVILNELIEKVTNLDNQVTKNEEERQKNEQNRIQSENQRQEYIEDLKKQVENGDFNGKDAMINGVNTLNIIAGENIGLEQKANVLTISNTYDDSELKKDVLSNKTNIDKNSQEITDVKENYSLITETGNKISLTINSSTYVMTLQLKDKNGSVLSTGTIDLPLELIVKSGRYDSETKNLVLTLANEDVINIPVGELVDEYYADGTTIELKDVNGKLTFNVKNGVYQEKQTGKGLSTNDFTNDYKSNVDENTKNRHSHTNKSVLDSTTASFKTKDKTNLDSNTSARHTHSNKAVLDATTASFTTEMKNTISGLSKVATSGSYSDLSNKPTIPSVVDNLTSTSTSSSLSAKQGKVLNDKIESMNQMNYANAGFHNSIFRGADVTKYLTDGNLYTRISNGTFEDLYVGDYIIKNNITWRIAGFDVYYNKGDTAFTKHHAIIVPDTNLTTGRMNSTNTTVGGVAESEMYKTTLNDVLSNYITPVFGTHVLEYRQLLTTGINATGYNRFGNNGGCSNAWAWSSRKLDLMNEVQVYGSIVWSSSGYDIGSDNVQLPLFRLAPQ